jgi:hypothetical protein
MSDCEAARLGCKPCVSPPRWLAIEGRRIRFDAVGQFLLCNRHAQTRRKLLYWRVRPIEQETSDRG